MAFPCVVSADGSGKEGCWYPEVVKCEAQDSQHTRAGPASSLCHRCLLLQQAREGKGRKKAQTGEKSNLHYCFVDLKRDKSGASLIIWMHFFYSSSSINRVAHLETLVCFLSTNFFPRHFVTLILLPKLKQQKLWLSFTKHPHQHALLSYVYFGSVPKQVEKKERNSTESS